MIQDLESIINIVEKFCNVLKNIVLGKLKKHNEPEKHTINEEELPYYFKNYKKHLTIYPNGNGIIINSATMVVKDKSKLDYIYRKLNIEDGKNNSEFPSIETMCITDKTKRFDNYGFWYYSKDNIITNAEEFYWSDTDPEEEDQRIKDNNKEIRWRFFLNTSKIENDGEYDIKYAVSVKGLFPIEDGKFNPSLANDPNSKRNSSSTFFVIQEIKNFVFEIAFDDSIKLQEEPMGEVVSNNLHKKSLDISEEKSYNFFYKKYIFNVENPGLGNRIKVKWKFQEMEDDEHERKNNVV